MLHRMRTFFGLALPWLVVVSVATAQTGDQHRTFFPFITTQIPRPTTVAVISEWGGRYTPPGLDPIYYVVGELYNGLDRPVYDPRLELKFFDAAGPLPYNFEVIASLPYLGPGERVPFQIYIPDYFYNGRPVTYHEIVDIRWTYAEDRPVPAGPVLVLAHELTPIGSDFVMTVQVRNILPYAVRPTVAVTFYDEAGKVVEVWEDANVGIVAPGATGSTTFERVGGIPFATYTVQAGGEAVAGTP